MILVISILQVPIANTPISVSLRVLKINHDASLYSMQGLQCPASEEVTTPIGKSTATVHWVEPVHLDVTNHVYKINCNSTSGTNFPIGTTRVECVATDMRGINKTCHYDITVEGRTIIS